VSRARRAIETPFGAALAGGVVVAIFGWIAIAAGWVHAKPSDEGLGDVAAPLSRPASDSKSTSTVNRIYRADAPGVAFIEATSAPRPASPFDLFGPPERRTATGSGFVVDKEGDILTNNHVVAGASEIRVTLGSDKATVPAQRLGVDASNDLALIKVDPGKVTLHPLPLGDSNRVEVGDPVVAIGNPFGLDRTVTTGIVSALQRQIQAPNGFTISNVIQTDASINPGNSGGPLIDAGGRVIGINSQIETAGGGGSVGVGFAIPIDTARQAIDQLRHGGQVKRAFLGVDGADIGPDLAKALNLPASEGILVQQAFPGGPAAKAGIHGGTTQATINGSDILLGGDIIVAADGHKVTSMQEIVDAVNAKKPGDPLKLTILRDGKRRDVTVALGQRPERIRDTAEPQLNPFGQ
jgi:S1-C subfamily serine protease